MKRLFFLFAAILLISCCSKPDIKINNISTTRNFTEFTNILIQTLQERDTNSLRKILFNDFQYTVYDHRDNYSYGECLTNFDFDLVDNLVKDGIEVGPYDDSNYILAFAPPTEKLENFRVYFRNHPKTDGWKITAILSAP